MTKKKRTFWNFVDHFEGDKVVWIIALMLILISIVCIFSSTSRLLEGSQTRVDIVKSQLLIVAAAGSRKDTGYPDDCGIHDRRHHHLL